MKKQHKSGIIAAICLHVQVCLYYPLNFEIKPELGNVAIKGQNKIKLKIAI